MHGSILVYQFTSFSTWDSFDLTTVCFAVMWSHRPMVPLEDYAKPTIWLMKRPDHNTVCCDL